MKIIVVIAILVVGIFGCKSSDEDESPKEQITEVSNDSASKSTPVAEIDTCGNRVVINVFGLNKTRLDVELLGESKSIVFDRSTSTPKPKDCNCGEIGASYISWDLIPRGIHTFKLTTYKNDSVTEVDSVVTRDIEVKEGCNRFETHHFFGFEERNPFEE